MAQGTAFVNSTKPTGTNTYDLTVGIMLDIDPLIQRLNPNDVPLQGGYGSDPAIALPRDTCFEKKVEWLDEVLLTPQTTLGASFGGSTNTIVDLIVATGDRPRFTTGDILLVQSLTTASVQEYVRVTGYSATTADDLLVTRQYNSSTLSTFVTGATVLGMGTNLAEGSDPNSGRYVDRSDRYNMTQIFGPYMVEVSGSDDVVRKYGIASEFDHQVMNQVNNAAIAIDQGLLYGTMLEDTSNKRRTMGGFTWYITAANGSNINSTTTNLTEDAELTQLQALWTVGGHPDTLMVGGKTKRYVSANWVTVAGSATTGLAQVQIQRNDMTRGTIVRYYESDFGAIAILLNRYVNQNNAFNFQRDQATIKTLRPLSFEMLGKTGDARKGQVVGEKTLKFERAKHAGMFTALT